jgi:hypothetical protein
MNDRVKIMAGLALFLVLATFPIWRAFGSARPDPPELAKPVRGSQCVEGTEWITANHPQLLTEWRDAVVREGRKVYTSTDGVQHEMSLSKTCLGCHENREAFCGRCHDYASVQLTCWNCHLDSRQEGTEP